MLAYERRRPPSHVRRSDTVREPVLAPGVDARLESAPRPAPPLAPHYRPAKQAERRMCAINSPDSRMPLDG